MGYTTDNRPVAVIDDNILDGVPKSQWIKIVKETISDKFSGGVPIGGRLIKVNSVTKNEYINSKYSNYLRASDGTVYADKLKSASNVDDIIIASTDYINEDLKHTRKDNFKEFARGSVLIRVGGNDYSANVIVGFTSGNKMVLYDVIDFNPATFKLRNNTKNKDVPQGYAKKQEAHESGTSIDPNIPQKVPGVNTHSMQNSEKDAGSGRDKFSIPEATAEMSDKERVKYITDLNRAFETRREVLELTYQRIFPNIHMICRR